MPEPSQSSSLADAQRVGVEAYAAFHRAVSDPARLEDWLGRVDREQRDEVLAVARSLPSPHPALPLRLLLWVAQHLRWGALEWAGAIPGEGEEASQVPASQAVKTAASPASAPLERWLDDWAALLDPFYPELGLTTGLRNRDHVRRPWAGWRPPPDDLPYGAGRFEWEQAIEAAREVAAALGQPSVDATTLWFVVLRDGFLDLEPLLSAAGVEPMEALEDALEHVRGRMTVR